jgi:tetratricopeptide (TPR) repeat protein
MPATRPVRAAVITVAVALVLTIVGAVAGRIAGPRTTPVAVEPATEARPADRLGRDIEQLRQRLRRVPGDWVAWARLGTAYLERARVTTDPTWYTKAEQAVRRSLEVRPESNVDALAARGALANARHDFAAARRDALAAAALNDFHADAYAVLADAETQLGHRAAAGAAVQRLLDLRPGLPAYARASYDLEQRGRTGAAADLMRQALATAVDRYDIAFCREQLGDLALGAGDLDTAGREYRAGLAADPTSPGLRRGTARVAAAAGHLHEALRAYGNLTRRSPSPSYLLEYAELLRAAGRDAEARVQLRLAGAAHDLFVASGGRDGLTGAALATATGAPDRAVDEARAEWTRRRHVDVADTLAWTLHLAGADREALGYARRAHGSGARSAVYAYHLGLIERALGQRTAAARHLRAALDINPYFSPADAAAARRALTDVES